jgi:hypothetical protein
MVLSPLLEQHLDVRLYQSKRRHNINVSHPLYLANTDRLVFTWQIDDHDSSGLVNVNVRRPVLSRREKDAHAEPAVPQDGRH